jgi:SAM-dependent methyltransferase
MGSRFAQGFHVDRDRPHIFHRDYWTLRTLRDAIRDFLRDHAGELRGRTALDFGAGQSPYEGAFAAAGITLLRADIEPLDEGTLLIDVNTGRVPLDDSSVDAIISTQVLEHLADPPAYLREAARLLKPGGLLYLTTHGAFVRHGHPRDYRRWMIEGLQHELESAGFTVQKIEPRIGILATSTHLRSIALGAMTRRVPGTGWLRPLIYLCFNLRMAVEDFITPSSAMDFHPELLIATARKRGPA